MDNTILQQGFFTSSGSNVIINLRSDVDWMIVYNQTQGGTSQTTAVGVKHYWQRGFAQGSKWTTFKSNAAAAANAPVSITLRAPEKTGTPVILLLKYPKTNKQMSVATIENFNASLEFSIKK